MTFKVIAMDYKKSPLDLTIKTITDAGIEFEYIPCKSENDMIQAGKNADVILVGTVPHTTGAVIESLPKLKMIARHGVGVDSVDLVAATEKGICVTNTPGVNTSEVADHAVALLLSITRNIPYLNDALKQGHWSNPPEGKNISSLTSNLRRISGNTVGIFGFGNIGKAFASRIRGFGPGRIIACDPYVNQTSADLFGVELVDFDTLITQSDFISVHSPSSEETKHRFNYDVFSKMKPNAIFINCARGPIVDELGLQEALEKNLISAAGIDVTETEPVSSESPLLKLNNLFITPHIAGNSDVSQMEGAIRWGENAVNVLTGKPLHGLANQEVLKRIAVIRSQGQSRWDNIPDPTVRTWS
ncbi:MAG: hydroxyacid dehydrogenase [Dehalococcoidia bacterium]|nr:hydroxyacid dehydrogenase [Dehalococcoidia bacterium]MQG09474.1 C-terminal binding protein [SAR202 cluster bacterium]